MRPRGGRSGLMSRIPQTVLAAAVGAMLILTVTVLASRVAIFMHQQPELRLIERLGEVYLDGLSATVAPYTETGRHGELATALERVAAYHDGVREVRVMVRTPAGAVIGDLARDEPAAKSEPPPVDTELSLTTTGDRNRYWIQRPLLVGDRVRAILSAQLDLKPIREERLRADLKSLAVNAILAIGLAGLGFVLMRRLLAPLKLLEEALNRASQGDPHPIPLPATRSTNPRLRNLLREYNRMARAFIERRQVQIAQAERLRAADLGRLAATVAHEVRNPLTGMLNAVDTARRFPDNREAVSASLDLLDRGLTAIARVVETTLSIYRPSAHGDVTRQVDFDDLERLIAPVAERQKVELAWKAAVGGDLPLDGSMIRQIILNLALNAINATPPGGSVGVEIGEEPGALVARISDGGPGLDDAAATRLAELDLDWIDTTEGGIGLGVVIRAVASLDGRVEARALPGPGGTIVVVRIPVEETTSVGLAPRETSS